MAENTHVGKLRKGAVSTSPNPVLLPYKKRAIENIGDNFTPDFTGQIV